MSRNAARCFLPRAVLRPAFFPLRVPSFHYPLTLTNRVRSPLSRVAAARRRKHMLRWVAASCSSGCLFSGKEDSQTDSGLILTWEDLALSRIDARQSLDSRFLRPRPVYILSMTLDAAIYGAFVKDGKRSTSVSRNDTEE